MEVSKTTATMMVSPRSLVCHYNPGMVVAALVVSLLGAFTSTQLMSQARGARTLSGVLIRTGLSCLTFGFCGTWCLHFLGMLSCEFDIPISLHLPLTVLSAVLAVSFTFGALSTELIQKYWRRPSRKNVDIERRSSTVIDHHLRSRLQFRQHPEPLLHPSLARPKIGTHKNVIRTTAHGPPQSIEADHSQDEPPNTDTLLADNGSARRASQGFERLRINNDSSHRMVPSFSNTNQSDYDYAYSDDSHSTAGSRSRLLLDNRYLGADTTGMSSSRSNSVYEPSPNPPRNTLLFAAQTVLNGLTLVNVTKDFVWSIALTNMHFMGVKALDIPGGFVALSPARVILCALISWSVCCVGVILMAGMEVNIKQQVLFSVVAATGVAAVHFSGLSDGDD
jgi:NO-binding membrane sensor protein with MHYT domain